MPQVLVLDNGASTIKAGLADNDGAPKWARFVDSPKDIIERANVGSYQTLS